MASTFRTSLRAQLRTRPSAAPSAPRPQTRFASTSSSSGSSVEQAQKTAQNAYNAASKHAGSAFESAKKAAGPIGERLGSMLGSYRGPIVYKLAVAREFLKQVYVAERLQPPMNLQVWVDAYSTLAKRARDLSYWKGILNNGEWKKVGIYGLEAYGIFKIGEILGRRHMVGYKLE